MRLPGPDSVRPEVEAFTPYSPGLSIDEIRERFGLTDIIKLASNEYPLGVSPLAREAVERCAGNLFRYPQSGNLRLVQALAARHGLDPASVVVGNGSDEIIDLLIRIRAAAGAHNVVVCRPSFSLYALQSRLCGVELRSAPLNEDFSFDFEALLELTDADTAIVFITTPDNPSGFCPQASEVRNFAERLPKGCLLAVDEAYLDFADEREEQSPPVTASNIAVLRTFSKSFGLAGLRLGYGLLPPRLAGYLRRVRLPFSVNILAEEAGLAALRDDVFRAETLRVVRAGRERVTAGLHELGCRVWPSQANFLMFRPPAEGPGARELFDALLQQGIIIRSLASYGLPALLRVSMGTERENACFLHACKELFQK